MLSPSLRELIEGYYSRAMREAPGGQAGMLHVDEVASRIAVFYEKVRKLIDYQEEHLLRKRFIDRVLARRLSLSLDANIGESLIKDTIRAGHLPNDSVPEKKIGEVQDIIDRFSGVREHLRESLTPGEFRDVHDWFLKITASGIEECLFSPEKDMLIARAMFKALKKHRVVQGDLPKDTDVDAQLWIAIQRALLRVDKDQLQYRLLKFISPEWDKTRPEEHKEIAQKLPALMERIEALLDDPTAPQFYTVANRYNTVFYLLGDLIESAGSYEEFARLTEDEDKLNSAVESAYRERVRHERGRLQRLGFLIVLSFFISKIAIAILIEIPIEIYLAGGFSLTNTIINIVFPPFLMYMIASTIRPPSPRNLDLILREIKAVAFEEVPAQYMVTIPKERRGWVDTILNVVYALTFVVSLYVLWRILKWMDFNLANAVIFVFFVSLVAATGVKIHNRAREVSLEDKKRGFLSFVFDLFAVPFIRIGKWIIAGLAKFNVFIVLFNVLIEVPIQVLIDFVEEFSGFLKSKKEEIN